MKIKDLLDKYNTQTSIAWDSIKNLSNNEIIDWKNLSNDTNQKIISKIAIVKLNGGLGTSMGCSYPKSLIQIKKYMTFLDVVIDQIEYLNLIYNTSIPLILMNSEFTDKETKEYLNKRKSNIEIYCFKQSFFPRLDAKTLKPVTKSNNIDNINNWYPPGHGCIYSDLYNSPVYDILKKKGIEYLFISNIDNLAASFDNKIFSYIYNKFDFCIELTQKTLADVKGGTIIKYQDKLKLLEKAEVPEKYLHDFYSIEKFKFFNTNNLWVKLDKLTDNLIMDVVFNPKKVDNLEVVQLEVAMGSAIINFEKSICINVPRTRFFPVKKCSDLFLLRSNLVSIKNGYISWPKELPLITLDKNYDKLDQFEENFKNGIPDISQLKSLKINGNIKFVGQITLTGEVEFSC